MLLNEVYFWTDTIKDWNATLEPDRFKEIVVDCWRELTNRQKIAIYGFVIMPNHLHVIWEMLEMNGKEMPHASFNKFTSHQFLNILRAEAPSLAPFKESKDLERQHRFWQRDPLAIQMYSRKVVEQKLEYIHLNPLQEQWTLVSKPGDYKWSSARFYESGIDEFGFIRHYMDRF